MFQKGIASRGWWKPDASKRYLNITPELHCRKVTVSSDGISPLTEKHMSVCTGGIMIVQAFILLLGMGAFLFLPENLVCTSGIII